MEIWGIWDKRKDRLFLEGSVCSDEFPIFESKEETEIWISNTRFDFEKEFLIPVRVDIIPVNSDRFKIEKNIDFHSGGFYYTFNLNGKLYHVLAKNRDEAVKKLYEEFLKLKEKCNAKNEDYEKTLTYLRNKINSLKTEEKIVNLTSVIILAFSILLSYLLNNITILYGGLIVLLVLLFMRNNEVNKR